MWGMLGSATSTRDMSLKDLKEEQKLTSPFWKGDQTTDSTNSQDKRFAEHTYCLGTGHVMKTSTAQKPAFKHSSKGIHSTS